MTKKTTSFKLDEDLWLKLKINAVTKREHMSTIIEDLIREYLEKEEAT